MNNDDSAARGRVRAGMLAWVAEYGAAFSCSADYAAAKLFNEMDKDGAQRVASPAAAPAATPELDVETHVAARFRRSPVRQRRAQPDGVLGRAHREV